MKNERVEGALVGALVMATLPLMVINMVGGIVSAIWLLFLGKWALVGWGIVTSIFGVGILRFIVLLGFVFTRPGLALLAREDGLRTFSYPFLFLGLAWTYTVMCVWALGVFIFVTADAYGAEMIPSSIWAYTIATVPWAAMAQRDAQGGNDASSTSTIFLQVGCLVAAIVYLLGGALTSMAIAIVGIMIIAFLASISTFIEELVRQQRMTDLHD